MTTRRRFLLGSAALAGGGAVFGWRWLDRPYDNPLLSTLGPGEATLNRFLKISADNRISIAMPRAEMGQGIHGALAALIAEELQLEWGSIEVFHAPPDPAYANRTAWCDTLPFLPHDRSRLAEGARSATSWVSDRVGLHFTGASTSMRGMWLPMRRAGAAARIVLFEEAAQRLGVPSAELSIDDRHVVARDGTRLAFGALAAAAALRDPPVDPPLRSRSEWRIIGRSPPRPDVPPKVDGTAIFSIDTDLPDLCFAAIVQNPCLGAGVRGVTDAEARRQPGVSAVVILGHGVAVVADGTWRALRALRHLEIDWEGSTYPPTTADQIETLQGLCASGPFDRYRDEGDAIGELDASARVHTSRYVVPYLAHFTMEPINATAQLADNHLHLWIGTQVPSPTQHAVAAALGLSLDQVTIHSTLLGGGFGRRGEVDFAVAAAQVAAAVSPRPVKVLWSREQDTTHDFYRPAVAATYRGALDADGYPHVLHAAMAGQDVMPQYLPRVGGVFPVADVTSGDGTRDQPYRIAHFLAEHADPGWSIPVGPWRSVGFSANGFMMESFLDELAHEAGKDPVEVRLHLLRHDPVATAVVTTVAELAGWGTPLPRGWGRGIAFQHSFGSNIAQVAEISMDPDRGLKVERICCVVDVGIAVQPDNIVAQIEGGIAFGLSAALLQRIDFEAGRVVQSNLHDYPVLRIHQMPRIEVRVSESGHAIGGVGEVGVGPVAAAVANALFDATGQRIRSLPLRDTIRVYG